MADDRRRKRGRKLKIRKESLCWKKFQISKCPPIICHQWKCATSSSHLVIVANLYPNAVVLRAVAHLSYFFTSNSSLFLSFVLSSFLIHQKIERHHSLTHKQKMDSSKSESVACIVHEMFGYTFLCARNKTKKKRRRNQRHPKIVVIQSLIFL